MRLQVHTVQVVSATILATSLAYKIFATLLRRRLRAKYTAIYDVDALDSGSGNREKKKGTVVIAGGSIAGLFAARICADNFTEVIIVDPEAFKSLESENSKDSTESADHCISSTGRSRVYQYLSLHAYQPFSLLVLRKLFPDFNQQLSAVGGFAASDPQFHTSGRPIPAPKKVQFEAMALSRDIYEPLLRRLILSRFSNIKQITGSVIAVQSTTDNWERLGSVSVQSGGVTTTYGAALVIDCSGRASSGYQWFKDTPVDTKQSDTPSGYLPYSDLTLSYDHKLGSVTCEFIVPANFLETIGCSIDLSSSNLYVTIPDYKLDGRAVVIALREHNRLQISFGGYDIRKKMTTVGDIRTFFSEMVLYEPFPEWVSNLLDEVEEKQYPPSIWTWRVPPSTYTQYHRAAKLPCNFVAIGDSVLTLNPVPGQGCTKACIEAVTLNSLLKSVRKVDATGNIVIPSGFSNKFFQSQLYRTGRLWDSNRASDYGFETVVPAKGDDHSFGKDQRDFIHGKLLPMIITDDETAAIFWAVSAFLEAPTEMMFPSFLFKVWWNSTKARLFSS